MGTAACGIDCGVCRLHVAGLCSTCGSGISDAGRQKLEAQKRLFGQACAVLECAIENKIAFCMRDCDRFPCEQFSSGSYPFSPEFLAMQERRREKIDLSVTAAWPSNTPEIWNNLRELSSPDVCRNSGAALSAGGKYLLQCLNETWEIDPNQMTVVKTQGAFGGEWDRQVPYLMLYYLTCASADLLSGEMTAPRDLPGWQNFFKGRYTLETTELESCFGRDVGTFTKAAEQLGGRKLGQADAAVRFHVFKKFPVDYLLWVADEEFPSRVTILLDRSLPEHFVADGTSVIINLLSRRLLDCTEK